MQELLCGVAGSVMLYAGLAYGELARPHAVSLDPLFGCVAWGGHTKVERTGAREQTPLPQASGERGRPRAGCPAACDCGARDPRLLHPPTTPDSFLRRGQRPRLFAKSAVNGIRGLGAVPAGSLILV